MKYFTCFFVLIAFSCSAPEAELEAPAVNKLPKNKDFVIILPEDHRKGNTWQLQQDYDTTVIQQINEVWHGNDKGIYFNLSTRAMGQTTLNFINRKFTDTLDNKHFIIQIRD